MVKDGKSKIDNSVADNLNLPSFTFTFVQKVAAQNLILAVKKLINTNEWDEEKVINLPEHQAWLNAIKGYSATKLYGSWQDTAISDRSLQVDLLNMRDDQVYELSQFSADVINKLRNDLGVSNLVADAMANPRMVSTVQEVSRLGMENPDSHPGYDLYALKKAAYDHRMITEDATAADRQIASTNPYGEMLMILANNQFTPQISVAEAKERIVSAVANVALISNGKCLGSAEKIIGVLSIPNDRFDDNNEYVGATISFKKLKYDSVIRPSYLIHLIQHESWQDVDDVEEEESIHSQMSDQGATGEEAKNETITNRFSDNSELSAMQPSRKTVTDSPATSELPEKKKTMGEPTDESPARTAQGDTIAEKDKFQGHNRIKALKIVLTEVIIAVAYLLGLKKYN